MVPKSRAISAPITLQQILAAIDFSDCMARVLSCSLGLAQRYAARLKLLYCVDPTPYNLGTPEAVESACDCARRDMEKLVSRLRSKNVGQEIEIEPKVEAGDVATVLAGAVENLNQGLVVVGTHGRTGWRKLVLGSVAEKVVDSASCPVLTVGPLYSRTRIQEFGPESILLAVDSSVRSRLAESYALSLARKYNSRLTRVDFSEPGPGRVLAQGMEYKWPDSESSPALIATESLSGALSPAQCGARSDQILRVAEHVAADLLVLPVARDYRFTDRFASTDSYRVVCGSPCPVLTVRSQ
jgi:nucleotide-binding universal stress UspA family protein